MSDSTQKPPLSSAPEQALSEPEGDGAGDPAWFREPTPREHAIAAGLFVAFGLFFVALFIVQQGWWFRWVVLVLGIYSIADGGRHALDARRARHRPNG